MFRSTQYIYYVATYTVIKAMVYTFLLWYPIFLDSQRLKKFSGYITILFEIAAIIGSLVLGKLYEYEGRYNKRKQNHNKNTKLQ